MNHIDNNSNNNFLKNYGFIEKLDLSLLFQKLNAGTFHSRTVASMRETGWEQQQKTTTTSRSSSSQRFDSVKWIRFWSCWSLLSSL